MASACRIPTLPVHPQALADPVAPAYGRLFQAPIDMVVPMTLRAKSVSGRHQWEKSSLQIHGASTRPVVGLLPAFLQSEH